MEKFTVLLLFQLIITTVYCQQVDVVGDVKISKRDTITTGENVAVFKADGTLAERNLNQAIMAYFTSFSGGIQTLLDLGESPLNLYNAGTPANSLYGKSFAGGLIFYLDTLDIHPFEGMVAASSDQSVGTLWGCHGTPIIGADGIALGTGNQNTIDIINGCIFPNIAALICADLVLNGYNDWFLPSLGELRLMWKILHRYGCSNIPPDSTFCPTSSGSFTSSFYWSSTEENDNMAWVVNFFNGTDLNDPKLTLSSVRAIRVF